MKKLKKVFVVTMAMLSVMGIYVMMNATPENALTSYLESGLSMDIDSVIGDAGYANDQNVSFIDDEVITTAEVDWHSEYYKQKAEEQAKYVEECRAQIRQRKEEELQQRIAAGEVLTQQKGVNYFEGHSETYYNLPMDYIISVMRDMGFSEEEYPYWVREDGCKMLGDYIMVAADLSIHPRGSIVETSLGTGLVCDTGGFVEWNSTNIDIATDW